MRLSVFLAALVLPTVAHAADTYFAVSTEVLAGAGFEGLNVTSVGLDATAGYRLSRYFAIETFFTSLVDTQPYRLNGGGQMCSGNYTEQFHWETFGVRFWIRAVRSKHVDFSIAPPTISGGAAFTHGRPIVEPTGFCAELVKPRDFHGAMAAFELVTFALELHFDEHFGWRFMAGAEIDLALDADLGILSVSASAGPVFHF